MGHASERDAIRSRSTTDTFSARCSGWRETPPDPKLPAPDVANIAKFCPNGHEGEFCVKYGYERMLQECGYQFFKQWTGPGFPRVIMVTIQHANPCYDDSYAVNSENLGPYGDAITYELIPHIEQTFRGIGPWARAVYGGSTGGWEALGVQVLYPDLYSGAYANCPDPIDFRSYDRRQRLRGQERVTTPRVRSSGRRGPGSATTSGRHARRSEQNNIMELVLGTRVAIRRAVGYLGSGLLTGRRRWISEADLGQTDGRDRQECRRLLARPLRPRAHHAARLGHARAEAPRQDHAQRRPVGQLLPQQRGLSRAEDFLKSANPPADARVDYGMKDEHCWSGDHEHVNAISRLTYNNRFIPLMAEHWQKTAPKGGDVKSWRC